MTPLRSWFRSLLASRKKTLADVLPLAGITRRQAARMLDGNDEDSDHVRARARAIDAWIRSLGMTPAERDEFLSLYVNAHLPEARQGMMEMMQRLRASERARKDLHRLVEACVSGMGPTPETGKISVKWRDEPKSDH